MASHFGVDEHPFAIYFDVHQGYRVLTHSQTLHHLETMVEARTLVGESSYQGFLGGAKWISSIHNMGLAFPPRWFSKIVEMRGETPSKNGLPSVDKLQIPFPLRYCSNIVETR